MTESFKSWVEDYIEELKLIGMEDEDQIIQVLMEDIEGHVITIVEDYS